MLHYRGDGERGSCAFYFLVEIVSRESSEVSFSHDQGLLVFPSGLEIIGRVLVIDSREGALSLSSRLGWKRKVLQLRIRARRKVGMNGYVPIYSLYL